MSNNIEKINLAYVVTENYIEAFGVSLTSFLINDRSYFDEIDIYIISPELSDISKRRIEELVTAYNVTIRYIDMPNSQNYFNDERFTIKKLSYSFAKLLFCSIIPKSVDKILVFDCDTIIL